MRQSVSLFLSAHDISMPEARQYTVCLKSCRPVQSALFSWSPLPLSGDVVHISQEESAADIHASQLL